MIACCVLRSGGDFKPEHVQWLAHQVPGIVCLSDVPVPGVKTIPLVHDLPGWWSKMEMFGPSIAGDVLMIDLDTVVLDMPDEPDQTTVLHDFTRPEVMGSGFMYVTAEDRERVWAAWMTDPAGHMASCTRWPRWGDQGFLQDHIGDAAKWGSDVVSYKVHCRQGLPKGARVVCFHGKPRPWEVARDWIPQMRGRVKDFRELILKHRGARICVMGGAPSLAADLESVDADLYISTNAHGVEINAPAYVLAMDERHGTHGVDMGDFIRLRTDAPIISPHGFADYRLGYWPQNPRFVLSGLVAAWAAWAIGAKVVILAGFDAYDGKELAEVRKIARDIHGPVRVVGGGPMAAVWPQYDPGEKFGRYKASGAIDGLIGVDGLVTVRAIKSCRVGKVDIHPGEQITAMRHELHRLIRHRMVAEV